MRQMTFRNVVGDCQAAVRLQLAESGLKATLAPKERESFRNELLVVLENAAMSGIVVKHEL